MHACTPRILRVPVSASREDAIFLGESLYQEQESPWAITLTEPLLEAFKLLHADWPQK